MARKPTRPQTRRPRRRKFRSIAPVLVSAPEFSRLSGLGYSLVRQLVADGVLPVRMVGSRVWIIREPAVAWLCKQVEPRPAA
jgi:hypothetical protein